MGQSDFVLFSVIPAKGQGCPENRTRLLVHYPVQPKSIPVAGLVPVTRVSRSDTAAAARRECPGQARARGSWRQNSTANTPQNCRSTFPRQACAKDGIQGNCWIPAALDPRFRGGDDNRLERTRSSRTGEGLV